MPCEIFVDIGADLDHEVRERLAIAAYRASSSNSVAIVLRGVSAGDVDRMLDPVVREEGVNGARVRYFDPDVVRAKLRAEAVEPRLVVTCDPGWMKDASGVEVRVEGPEAGLRFLEEQGGSR